MTGSGCRARGSSRAMWKAGQGHHGVEAHVIFTAECPGIGQSRGSDQLLELGSLLELIHDQAHELRGRRFLHQRDQRLDRAEVQSLRRSPAETVPSSRSAAVAEPTVAISIPRPTSARNSRLLPPHSSWSPFSRQNASRLDRQPAQERILDPPSFLMRNGRRARTISRIHPRSSTACRCDGQWLGCSARLSQVLDCSISVPWSRDPIHEPTTNLLLLRDSFVVTFALHGRLDAHCPTGARECASASCEGRSQSESAWAAHHAG